MKKIVLYNPALSSLNMGDEIIFESAFRELQELFPESFFVQLSTHLPVSNIYMRNLKDADNKFVCGTNLLSAKMNARFRQWDITWLTMQGIGPAVLIGVGAWQYQRKPNFYTKILYKNVLSHELIHSVRDSYTEAKVREMGFDNVLNTGCPTMWKLTSEHCCDITQNKSRNVVCTLTDYMPDVENDSKMLNILYENYEKVYLWLQGYNDYSYLKSLPIKHNPILISPTLEAYDKILCANEDVDFVGTRLHAGIRALQKKRRSIIIGVDNRAMEKHKDFNLNVLERNKLDELEILINSKYKTSIRLPIDAINKWKSQFMVRRE